MLNVNNIRVPICIFTTRMWFSVYKHCWCQQLLYMSLLYEHCIWMTITFIYEHLQRTQLLLRTVLEPAGHLQRIRNKQRLLRNCWATEAVAHTSQLLSPGSFFFISTFLNFSSICQFTYFFNGNSFNFPNCIGRNFFPGATPAGNFCSQCV